MVNRWIENCSMHKEPSWLALGRCLKRFWQRDLERQRAIKQSKPAFGNKWQPSGPELPEGNRVRCNEGPICFALDIISQWHKEYRFVVGFLEEMEASVAFSTLENWGQQGFDASKPLDFNPAKYKTSASTAPPAPRGSSEGTFLSQRPRAQRKQAGGPAAPIREALLPKRTASLRTKASTLHVQHVQKQAFWAAMGAEGKDTLQSSVTSNGIRTGTPSTPRSSGRIPP